MNEKGIRPEELETADVTSGTKVKEVEPQFVDVVGQISLRSLERNAQKRKSKGSREQGIGAREQGSGNRDKGQGRREQGQGNRDRRTGNREQTGSRPTGQQNNNQPRTKPTIQIKKGDQ